MGKWIALELSLFLPGKKAFAILIYAILKLRCRNSSEETKGLVSLGQHQSCKHFKKTFSIEKVFFLTELKHSGI